MPSFTPNALKNGAEEAQRLSAQLAKKNIEITKKDEQIEKITLHVDRLREGQKKLAEAATQNTVMTAGVSALAAGGWGWVNGRYGEHDPVTGAPIYSVGGMPLDAAAGTLLGGIGLYARYKKGKDFPLADLLIGVGAGGLGSAISRYLTNVGVDHKLHAAQAAAANGGYAPQLAGTPTGQLPAGKVGGFDAQTNTLHTTEDHK